MTGEKPTTKKKHPDCSLCFPPKKEKRRWTCLPKKQGTTYRSVFQNLTTSWKISTNILEHVRLLHNSFVTLPKFNMEPENDGFPIGISFSRGWFSGSMFNFRGVFETNLRKFHLVPVPSNLCEPQLLLPVRSTLGVIIRDMMSCLWNSGVLTYLTWL